MSPGFTLHSDFATAFPELVVDSRAERQPDPRLVVLNDPLAEELGLDTDWLRTAEGLAFLTGEEPVPGSRPVAMAYAGHQFGQLSPRLGDGRALLLGELAHDGGLVDIHLKGSGPTVFSRGGDGRGALGPMLREFLMSEAMHALGVPTTRALAVISTGRRILREGAVPGALLVRVAASHLRVGTVQFARLSDRSEDLDLVARLLDYARGRHHPGVARGDHAGFFSAVMDTQLATVARWMRLGFVHGVMNTDNTTLSGETIDYGPCAFTDAYDDRAYYSSIDTGGRYAFGNQPGILGWNLARLAEAMIPLLELDRAQAVMGEFPARWEGARHTEAARTLGVDAGDPVVAGFLDWLPEARPDIQTLGRALVDAAGDAPAGLDGLVGDAAWAQEWRTRTVDADALGAVNPIYIPRNHLVDEALRGAVDGDLGAYERLLQAVTNPFEAGPVVPELIGPAPGDFGPFVTYCGT